MDRESTTQRVLFGELLSKPVVAEMDLEHSSSDGGALLLKATDERLGLTASLAACLRDARQPGKVRHGLVELVQQRVFGIALGYPDANDARALAADPIHKLLLGRDPIGGEALALQPSLSRFENGVRRGELFRMAEALADRVIARHRRRLGRRCRRITLDFDPTDDPTTGSRSSASSTATTTRTATCRSWARSPSRTRPSSTYCAPCCGRATPVLTRGGSRSSSGCSRSSAPPFRRRASGCDSTAA